MHTIFTICFISLVFISSAQTVTAKDMLNVINCKDTNCLETFLKDKKDYSFQKKLISNRGWVKYWGVHKSKNPAIKTIPDSLGYNYISYLVSKYNYCMDISYTTPDKMKFKKVVRGLTHRGFKFIGECESYDSECKNYKNPKLVFVKMYTDSKPVNGIYIYSITLIIDANSKSKLGYKY